MSKKLEHFRKYVDQIGSVFDFNNKPLDLSDWDSLIKRFATMGIKGEIIYYCSPKLLDEVVALLEEINAGYEGAVEEYGVFHNKDNSWSYMVEASFTRGSYTVHVVSKDIEGGILMPQLPEESWGTEQLAKSSINIITCQ